MVGHARGDYHHRLFRHFPSWVPSHHLRGARRVYGVAGQGDRCQSGAYDLWYCLLRHVVQLRGHGIGRYLGGSVVGPILGLGFQGKRRPHDRGLERHYPALPLGWIRERPWAGGAGAGCILHRSVLGVIVLTP